MIPDDFFQYIYHVGCAINLHSIINLGLIPDSEDLSNRQSVFFLLVDPMDKEHNNFEDIDLEAPRLAQGDLEDSKSTSGEHCAFWEATRLCQQVVCARSKLQFHTVLQKLKSFLLVQVYAWTVFPLSLFGIW